MRALGGATLLWASCPSSGSGKAFGNAMEAVMETIVLERAATSAPVKSRLQFGRRHLALAGLALALTGRPRIQPLLVECWSLYREH